MDDMLAVRMGRGEARGERTNLLGEGKEKVEGQRKGEETTSVFSRRDQTRDRGGGTKGGRGKGGGSEGKRARVTFQPSQPSQPASQGKRKRKRNRNRRETGDGSTVTKDDRKARQRQLPWSSTDWMTTCPSSEGTMGRSTRRQRLTLLLEIKGADVEEGSGDGSKSWPKSGQSSLSAQAEATMRSERVLPW